MDMQPTWQDRVKSDISLNWKLSRAALDVIQQWKILAQNGYFEDTTTQNNYIATGVLAHTPIEVLPINLQLELELIFLGALEKNKDLKKSFGDPCPIITDFGILKGGDFVELRVPKSPENTLLYSTMEQMEAIVKSHMYTIVKYLPPESKDIVTVPYMHPK